MMIFVNGQSKNKHALISEVIECVAKQLMSKRLLETLEINVECVYNLIEKSGHAGTAIWEDDDYRPKVFSMEVDTAQSHNELVTTIAHEMVHIKQYATNQLRQLNRVPYYRYGDKRYDLNTEYDKRPWEIEAYELEKDLAKDFLK